MIIFEKHINNKYIINKYMKSIYEIYNNFQINDNQQIKQMVKELIYNNQIK
jgi:hypothetical protein